jgi:putative ABC transport system permease protein
MNIIEIGWLQLALATILVLASASLSVALSLGLFKNILIATLRTYIQLIAMGLVLIWVFKINQAWLVLSVFAFMLFMTAQVLLPRVKSKPRNIFGSTLMAIMISGIIVTFFVTSVIIQVEPWYDARYILTIGGMVLGNSMNGIALALERLFDDLNKRRAEVEQLIALGATPWEATLPSLRTALAAGLMPTINSMNAVGLVFIPGMMTGQLIAGADPIQAAKYQIVIMLTISAASAIGAILSLYWAYARAFNQEGCLAN